MVKLLVKKAHGELYTCNIVKDDSTFSLEFLSSSKQHQEEFQDERRFRSRSSILPFYDCSARYILCRLFQSPFIAGTLDLVCKSKSRSRCSFFNLRSDHLLRSRRVL
jgi:hypothetical protein